MSAEATRMQDLASEFSKKNSGVIPRAPTVGGGDLLPRWATLSRTRPARPLAGHGAPR